MDPVRSGKRTPTQLRPLKISIDELDFADGSALIEAGRTRVLAAATIDERVPPFLKGTGRGWITAEYAMLPRATEERTPRERTAGRVSGRTQEIQRLVGRALRAVTDLRALGERQIIIDCDVIQADGGTRAASVTAGCVALGLALKKMIDQGLIDHMPLRHLVAGVSVGIVRGRTLLDLDYAEDSQAELDMNVIETDRGELVEVQAGAEKNPFSRKDLLGLLKLADKGIAKIIRIQKETLKKKSILFMAYGYKDKPGPLSGPG
ncbi:MAG: ribonuclease PH [Candidatus Aminicenantes bacterium RBG_16_63_14]|nr:MAG: ribonuclease PH [Candidatus Aminicenantes bacterium RBG_16_63_14]OGD28940.1 MAG: ribonuclease PH [Candidatus Aminicenantes bacterium RBG_19FT_COMBO_65_30]